MTDREKQSQAPLVVVVVVNWNGCERTLRCLSALQKMTYANLTVVVVDNASTDNSCASIRKYFPEVHLLETVSNLGFAGGANAGIRYAMDAGAKYVWLLNNDALPAGECLHALVATAESDPTLGEIGSVVVSPRSLDDIQAFGGGNINRWLGYCREAKTPWASGHLDFITAASVLVPVRAFEDVGLLDEDFFLYWEDVDFSFRLTKKGWKLRVARGAIVTHENGASTADDRSARDRYFTTSGIRFLCKHSPAPWLSVPFFVGARILKRVLKWQPGRLSAVGQGVGDFMQSPRLRSATRPS